MSSLATSTAERQPFLDVLRGFALLGVFLVNATMINSTMVKFSSHLLNDPWRASTPTDWISNLFVQVFGQGKFYTLFTLLFGLGFYLFIDRNRAKGLPAVSLFKRRLFFLLLFGLAHFSLVWYGDILHVYALCGFLMVPFLDARPRTLLLSALGLILFYIGGLAVLYALQAQSDPQGMSQGLSSHVVADQVYMAKDYLELIRYRTTYEFPMMLANLILFFPRVLGMFLVGLALGKLNFFKALEKTKTPILRMLFLCGPIAIITTGLYIGLQSQSLQVPFVLYETAPYESALFMLEEVSQISMAFTYLSLLALAYYKWPGATLFNGFSAVGRMALSNYLVQCILLALVFYGPGLGLMYTVGTPFSIALVLVFYPLQMWASSTYLKRHSQGPTELFWRKLTYAPIKKHAPEK